MKLDMNFEDFKATYVRPAVAELIRKVKADEPLSEIEAEILVRAYDNAMRKEAAKLDSPAKSDS